MPTHEVEPFLSPLSGLLDETAAPNQGLAP